MPIKVEPRSKSVASESRNESKRREEFIHQIYANFQLQKVSPFSSILFVEFVCV